jgi:TRAP-type transport system periplasmic protein
MKRSQFVSTATGGTLATIGVIATPARAAQFEYKLAHGAATSFSFAVRTVQAIERIRRETGGRLDIKVFPNSVLGNEISSIGQIKSNTIQFYVIPSIALSTAVPGLAVDGIGFAFRDDKAVAEAYDGPMGKYLQKLIIDKGIYAFPAVMNLGMRVVTSSLRPIHTAADFSGFKIRVQPGPIGIDLFRTLGASPTPIVFPELYLALQNHVVDGQETPYQTIEMAKFYEVQKYRSVTNHQPTVFWMIASMDGWKALPPDIQSSVTKNFTQAAIEQRRDTVVQSAAFADKLRRLGLTFNTTDVGSMRTALKPFYVKWKAEFGTTVWEMMEKTTGKLG